MEKTLEELQAEATALGIKFMPTIGADKLAKKIEDFYTSQAAGDSVKVAADPEPEVDTDTPQVRQAKHDAAVRKMVLDAKTAAMATRIVTISNNDKRESDVMTTAYLSMENQHFAISKYVPLDVPVELEECLIEVARTTFITLHKDEIIDGRRTGNKIPVSTRKFNISYEDIKKV